MTEYKAIQKSISTDYESGKRLITYEIQSGDSPESLEACKNKVLRLTVKQWKDKRSLDANSMYWKLLGELAKALKISNAYCHNIMLRRYGVIIPDMWVYVPDTDEKANEIDEQTTYHLLPTSSFSGELRIYYMLKGSSQMDSCEFSRVLEGLIEECNQCGIATINPKDMEMYFNGKMETDKGV
ncbi:MAG: hypothetical protein MR011_06120 [Lachnospiraceae bacterium]|nr:hypothetical protein [Lachnospiraceae bacterium]